MCAPSNGAVDEILLRVIKSGTDLKVLRVGANSYRASDELKEYDLTYKCQKLANKEKVKELKNKLQLLPADIEYL